MSTQQSQIDSIYEQGKYIQDQLDVFSKAKGAGLSIGAKTSVDQAKDFLKKGSKKTKKKSALKPVSVISSTKAKKDLANKNKFLTDTEDSVIKQKMLNASLADKEAIKEAEDLKMSQDAEEKKNNFLLKNKEIDAKTNLAKGVISPLNLQEEGEEEDPLDAKLSKTQQSLDDFDKRIEKNYQDTEKEIAKIKKGTFPLNTYEQTLVDALQNNLSQLKEQQILANKNYEGGVTQAGIIQGLSRYSPAMAQGQIFKAVSDGISKIKNIELEGAKALAELKQGFADKHYAQITDSYDRLDNLLREKKTAMQELHDEMVKQKEEVAKANQEKLDNFTTFQEDLVKTATANGAPQEVVQGILASSDKLGAYSAATGYLQSATGEVGNYQFYAKQERDAGRTPMSFLSYQHYQPPETGGGGFLSKVDQEILKYDTAFGDEFKKTEEYQQYATTKNAWGRITDTLGDEENPDYSKLNDVDVATIAASIVRMQRPDITRAADGGDQLASTKYNELVEQQYSKYVKGNTVLPNKVKEGVDNARKLYEGSKQRAKSVGDEIRARSKAQYGREAILPEIDDKAFAIVATESDAQDKVNFFIERNPDKAEMVASLFSKPSPAFDNKVPTNAQVYEYLKAKGLVK